MEIESRGGVVIVGYILTDLVNWLINLLTGVYKLCYHDISEQKKYFMQQNRSSKKVQVTYRTTKLVYLSLKQAALDERSSVNKILDRLVQQYLEKQNNNTKNNASSSTNI